MKAYKRQKIAMFVLLGAMAIGSSGTAFAATNTVSANDFNSKPIVTKMQKDSVVDMKTGTSITPKKTKKKHKKTTPRSIIATTIDNHKDGEMKDDKGGAPNSDEIKKTTTTIPSTTTKK